MKTRTKLKTALFLAAALNVSYASEKCYPPALGQNPHDVFECLQRGLDTQQLKIGELVAKTEKQQGLISELTAKTEKQQATINKSKLLS
jgi:hypothetical protein